MLINKRLILAHFWLAFVGVRRRRWCSAPGRCSCAARCNAWHHQSGILLSLGHRARLGDGLCVPDPGRDGVRLRDHRKLALERPLVGLRWAWAGFCLVAVGAVVAMVPVSLGLGLGALHLLSADGRQSLLLHRRRAWSWSARGSGSR